MTHGKTYKKSPSRINHKATRSKTNTGTTALERSVEQTTGGFKALLQLDIFILMSDFICHFSLPSFFPVLVAFTTMEHTSTVKSSTTVTQTLRYLRMNSVKSYLFDV